MPSEGEIPFDVPQAEIPCYTWYKVIDDLNPSTRISNTTLLVTLHNGPGACHEILSPLANLNEKYGIPVIFYDQIGNDKSTHIREKAGDESFWVEGLFVKELDNLIDYLGLWAGFDLYVVHKGEEALREALPKDVRETLERCEKEGRTDSEEYQKAMDGFRKRHVCRIDPIPEELKIAYKHLEEDPTVSSTMWGSDKWKPTGTLKDWTVIEDLHKIRVETFILYGRYDQVQDIAVIPFFGKLQRVRWVTLENSSHVGFFEERERYIELTGGFLAGFPE